MSRASLFQSSALALADAARSRRLLGVVGALVALGLLLIAAPAASAQPPTTYAVAGELPVGFGAVFGEAIALGESNGHIYVADSRTGTIYDFASPGDTSPTEWNGGEMPNGPASQTPSGSFGGERLAVAVDNSPGGEGDVYVADAVHGVIDKFDPNGNLIESFGDSTPKRNGQLAGLETPAGSLLPPGGFGGTFGIAVDQSNGDLYVIDAGHEVIDVFSSSGAYLRQITATPEGLYQAESEGPLTKGIAIDNSTGSSAGDVYVANSASSEIYKFNSSGDYLSTYDGVSLPNGPASEVPTEAFGNSIYVAVENATGHLLVASAQLETLDAFDSTGDFIPSLIPNPHSEGFFRPDAFAVNQSTGDLYVSINSDTTVQILKPQTVEPEATLAVSDVTATSAALEAHLNPAGLGEITACEFEYEASSGSQRVPCQTNPPPPYSGPVTVSPTISGLSPGAHYHVRLLVSNAGHTNTVFASFTTVGSYEFSAHLGSAGTGDDQFSEPTAAAVNDSTGDVYVTDTGNHRIEQLSSSGAFLRAWGWGVQNGAKEPQICTSGCQQGVSGSAPGQFEAPTFIAVDNSCALQKLTGAECEASDPSDGDVYVADPADDLIQKFTPEGNLITAWEDGGQRVVAPAAAKGQLTSGSSEIELVTTTTPAFSVGQQISAPGLPAETTVTQVTPPEFSYNTRLRVSNPATASGEQALTASPNIAGIAVRPDGQLVVQPGSGSGIAIDPAGAIHSGPIAIDPSTGYIYTDTGTRIRREVASIETTPIECNSAGSEECPESQLFGLGDLHAAKGLAFDPSSEVLYVANTGKNDLAVFTPTPLPRLRTGPVSNTELTSTTLTGFVEPLEGEEATGCRFQYGTDTIYSLGSLPCSTANLTGPAEVSAQLSNLTPFTTYHFRIVATDAAAKGLLRYGRDHTFTTTSGLVPGIGGTGVSGVTPTTATLTAHIDPNFAPTVYRFQYGLIASPGQATPLSESIGEDGADHEAAAELSGLTPGTAYRAHALAINFNGLAEGEQVTFNTPAMPSVVPGSASAITQTTATLAAKVKPGFTPTTYHFAYGPTGAYGSATPESSPIGSDNAPHPVGAAISGLSPGVTYHYRLIATNTWGRAEGPDQTFVTSPAEEKKISHCHKGFVLKHGHCVKKSRHHHKKKHSHRGGKK